MSVYAERRARALAGFEDGVAVIPSAQLVVRNNDTEYPFRQNSDFYYLTGFNEPDAVLVLAPAHPEAQTILFLRPRDRDQEVWNGRRLGVEAAMATLGVDAAHPIDELDLRLPTYLTGARTLAYELGVNEAFDRRMHAALERARALTRRSGRAPASITAPSGVLHALRARKSEQEVALMRRAAAITHAGFLAGMLATRPGAYEYEVQAAIEHAYRRAGAQGLAYDSIVASGANATTLHYTTNRDPLADGALLLVDSGSEFDCYASDVTRTWPINGTFTPEQRAVYEIVLAANEAGIAAVQPGASQRAFHTAALAIIVEGLIDLGVLTGSRDENIERETYREYYMHGAGHWIGLDVHDVGPYRDEHDEPVRLEPGMLTTVEPGIYLRTDSDAPPHLRGIGIRIEDDILVTADGNENLTAAIPKRAEEFERLVGA